MGVKILMFEYVKIKSHILKLIKMKMISWTIYMIMDYHFLVTHHFLNNFKIY
jgi:hypothetical protein